jgi:hypothetical protein
MRGELNARGDDRFRYLTNSPTPHHSGRLSMSGRTCGAFVSAHAADPISRRPVPVHKGERKDAICVDQDRQSHTESAAAGIVESLACAAACPANGATIPAPH